MKFLNPVIPGFYPDPSICRRDNDYFLVTSSFEYFPGVPLFHSTDLVNWKQIGHVLDRDSQLHLTDIASSDGIYAPTIRYHDGTFYMITTNVGGCGHFFVSTKDPFGSWSDPVYVDGPGFDPDLFFDDDGSVYFTREDITGHGIRQWKIDIMTGKLLGGETLIWDGFEDRLCEAPHIYRIGAWYYLLAAEGGTYRGHMVTIARSANVTGPYESCPENPVLTHRHRVLNPVQSTGHADIIQAVDGSWWVVFLATRPAGKWHNLGRETFLASVTWNAEGWPVINNGYPITLDGMEAPAMCDIQDSTTECVYGFDSSEWPCAFNFRRNPEYGKYVIDTARKSLILYGPSDPGRGDGFSFTGIRQRDSSCTVSVNCSFIPGTENDYAGLMILMNERHYYAVGTALRDGVTGILLHQVIGSLVCDRFFPVDTDSVDMSLRIDATPRCYTLQFAGKGSTDYRIAGNAECRYISSEVAGGFTGAYFGLFNGSKNAANEAVFRELTYKKMV